MTSESEGSVNGHGLDENRGKLHGRAFYESLGSPKLVLAPMVDQSEFAWRMLTRSFFPTDQKKSLLAYSPMIHARLFAETAKFRDQMFQPLKTTWTEREKRAVNDGDRPWLDGNAFDRPLFVQFCANKPDELLEAARHVAPFCDAVDLNLGCPQGIARKGNYGAFLQEQQDVIYSIIKRLHLELSVPVTAKIRILETKEKTLEYARMVLSAGASIVTVHGRQRDQKGHNTGLADWSVIRYLREELPPETVLFANGNILRHKDIEKCLKETGVDAVMSAEGNLNDPSIFAPPPTLDESTKREFWSGSGAGWRMDAVMRRYLDIIYKYILDQEPPKRSPLFIPGDAVPTEASEDNVPSEEPPSKRQKRGKFQKTRSPNLSAIQPHLFSLLRPLVARHHDVRDALAKSRGGDMENYERVLAGVERATIKGILELSETGPPGESPQAPPFFVCQPYIRPLPEEAIAKGSMTLSKKEKARLEAQEGERKQEEKEAGLEPEKKTETLTAQTEGAERGETVEVPREGLVCG